MRLMSQTKQYPNNQYPQDLQQFKNSLDRHGSVSRARGSLLRRGQMTFTLIRSNGFSMYDLAAEEHDHLKQIPNESLPEFAACLFWDLLLDQVVYTHFPEAYNALRHLIPVMKMDGSCGWAGEIGMANPYQVYWAIEENGGAYFSRHPERRSEHQVMCEAFEMLSEFKLEWLKSFFAQELPQIKYLEFLKVLLRDSDCRRGEYGKILTRLIETKLIEIEKG